MTRKKKNIGIGIDPRLPFGKQVIEGVAAYGLEKGDWDFAKTVGIPYLSWTSTKDWHGDGYIGAVSPPWRRQMLQQGIPFVNIATSVRILPAPSVIIDNEAVGVMAAEHLLDKGLKQFAVGLLTRQGHLRMRSKAFRDRIAQEGLSCSQLPIKTRFHYRELVSMDMSKVCDWLSNQGEPVGLFGLDDQMARGMIDAALEMGLRVPEDVAVLGEGNWPFTCDMLRPHLSSIDLGAERIGYRAAELLDAILHGATPPSEPILIQPRGLIQRRSTEVLATDDEVVRDALEYMYENCRQSIQVADVVRRMPVNRRALERRFRKVLGRSPAQELRRMRIRTACRMLVETDMPVYSISQACGFVYRERFNAAFRAETGLTPSRYRKTHRG